MATLAPQAKQPKASSENLNYATLAPQARPNGEILNFFATAISYSMIIGSNSSEGLHRLRTS